jgi:predicted RNase H-like HicB family nuclease
MPGDDRAGDRVIGQPSGAPAMAACRAAEFPLTRGRAIAHNFVVKQRYHSIIKHDPSGNFIGWVEEIPGAITHGRSLDECRRNLRESLILMVETHRDEARMALDESCIEEPIEIEISDLHGVGQHSA